MNPNRFAAPPREIDLAEGTNEWPVLKAGKFSAVTGPVEVRAEDLDEIAASYDPSVDRAAINYDHNDRGDALGWVQKLAVKNGVLMATVEDLDEDLVDKIKRKKRRYVSSEFVTKHSVTGGRYFVGLAVLGAWRPAVKALPEITVLSEGIATTVPIEGAAGAHEKEIPMSDPTKTSPAPNDSATVELAEMKAQLTAELEAAAKDRRAAFVERTTVRVSALLSELKDRLSPAQIKAGLERLLVALATAEQPTTVRLGNEAGQEVEVPAYDALVGVLKAQPLLKERLGSSATAADERAEPVAGAFTAAEQAYLAQHGIDDNRVKELVAKRPDAFRNPDAN